MRLFIESRQRHLQQACHSAGDAVICPALVAAPIRIFFSRCLKAKKAIAFNKNPVSIFASTSSQRKRALSARRSTSRYSLEDPWRSRSFLPNAPKGLVRRRSPRSAGPIGRRDSITRLKASHRYSGVYFLHCRVRVKFLS